MSVTLAVLIGVAVVLVPSILMHPSETTVSLGLARTEIPKPETTESKSLFTQEESEVTSYNFSTVGVILSSGFITASLVALISKRKLSF